MCRPAGARQRLAAGRAFLDNQQVTDAQLRDASGTPPAPTRRRRSCCAGTRGSLRRADPHPRPGPGERADQHRSRHAQPGGEQWACPLVLAAPMRCALSFLLLSRRGSAARGAGRAPGAPGDLLEPASAPRHRTAPSVARRAARRRRRRRRRPRAVAPVEPAAPSRRRGAVPRSSSPRGPRRASRASVPAPAAQTTRPASGAACRRLASAAPAAVAPATRRPPGSRACRASTRRTSRRSPCPSRSGRPRPGGPAGPTAPAFPGRGRAGRLFPHAWYLALLKEEVYARWSPQRVLSEPSPAVALSRFRITVRKDRGGPLKEGSGSARFDSPRSRRPGLGAVPTLPSSTRRRNLDVVIRFQNQR